MSQNNAAMAFIGYPALYTDSRGQTDMAADYMILASLALQLEDITRQDIWWLVPRLSAIVKSDAGC